MKFGESLITQLAETSDAFATNSSDDNDTPYTRMSIEGKVRQNEVHSNAMSWLGEFTQRKNEILGEMSDTPACNDLEMLSANTEPESCKLMARNHGNYKTDLHNATNYSQSLLSPNHGQCHAHDASNITLVSSTDEGFDRISPSKVRLLSDTNRSNYSTKENHVSAARMLKEILQKANLPMKITPVPNVLGLDELTASKVKETDAALMRKNYETLLGVLFELQQERELTEAREALAVQNQMEMSTRYELEIEEHKLERTRLKSELQNLKRKSSLTKVFEQYEEEIERVHREVQRLQSQNVALELKVRTFLNCMVNILVYISITCGLIRYA